MDNRLLIDIHTHILPREWPDLQERYGYAGFVQLEHDGPGCARMLLNGNCFREVQPNCWDPAVRIAECDNAGVSVQVLSTVPVMFSYWAQPRDAADLSRLLNDNIAVVVEDRPNRFIGL
ncbi:MAG TPA: amidohydrolase, partial [Rhodothermia bacterium]